MGEESGRGIWERNMEEEYGRGIWGRNLESERGIWEESGHPEGAQEPPRRHQKAPGGTQDAPWAPGDTQGTQEARSGSEIKV
jgi:hypothetical protein